LAGNPFVIVALSAKNEEKPFYKPRAGIATGASLYIEDTEHYRAPDTVTVQTRQLDQVVREHGWPRPDLMKLDVQGAELDVLAGGTECLNHCRLVIIETSIRRYNLGGPLIDDSVEKMKGYGVRVFDVMECHYDTTDALLQVDIMFERTEQTRADRIDLPPSGIQPPRSGPHRSRFPLSPGETERRGYCSHHQRIGD
jgi:hypothetical protein